MNLSPVLISVLILIGITILMLVAFISNRLEQVKLERARKLAVLGDTARRKQYLLDRLSDGYLTTAIRTLIARTIVDNLQAANDLAPSHPGGANRLELARVQMEQVSQEPVPEAPPPPKGNNDANEIKALLQEVHHTILDLHKRGKIANDEAKQHLSHIRIYAVQVALSRYTEAAKQAEGAGKPKLAIHQYSCAIQELEKQKPSKINRNEIKRLAELVKELRRKAKADKSDNSQLSSGLGELNDDEAAWKMKNQYDD